MQSAQEEEHRPFPHKPTREPTRMALHGGAASPGTSPKAMEAASRKLVGDPAQTEPRIMAVDGRRPRTARSNSAKRVITAPRVGFFIRADLVEHLLGPDGPGDELCLALHAQPVGVHDHVIPGQVGRVTIKAPVRNPPLGARRGPSLPSRPLHGTIESRAKYTRRHSNGAITRTWTVVSAGSKRAAAADDDGVAPGGDREHQADHRSDLRIGCRFWLLWSRAR